jgi:hypothetical protein
LLITTPRTSTRKSGLGWRDIRAFTSTLRRPRPRGALNAVEGFFATLTKRRLKRGVFKGIADLQAAIKRFLDEHNESPKPFVWTADPHAIIEKVRRRKQALESIH